MNNRNRLVSLTGAQGLEQITGRWLRKMSIWPDSTTSAAVDHFLYNGNIHGWLSKLPEGYLPVCGGALNLNDAVRPLKGITPAFTPSFVNIVTAVPRWGIIGDGTSLYKTGHNLAAILDINSHGAAVGVTSANTSSLGAELGALQTSNAIAFSVRASNGLTSVASSTSVALSFGNSNPAGLKRIMRTSDTQLFAGADQIVKQLSQTVTTLPNTAASSQAAQLCLLKAGVNGTGFSPNQINLAFLFTPALTIDEDALFASDYRQFLIDLEIADQLPSAPQTPTAGAGVFDKNAINAVVPSNLRVMMYARPPADNTIDKDTYNFFPVTDFITQEGDAGSQTSTFTPAHGGGLWFNHWQDRYIPPGIIRNPNSPVPAFARTTTYNDPVTGQPYIVSGSLCRVLFDSYVNACAATLTRIAHSIGWAARNEPRDPRGWGYLDYMENFPGAPYSGTYGSSTLIGTNCYAWADAKAAANSLFQTLYLNFACALDIVILKQARMCDFTNMPVKGPWMDTEAQDGRPHGLHALHYSMAAEICHAAGYSFSWITNNQLNTMNLTGFGTDSAPAIMATSDFYTANASHRNEFGDIITSVSAQLGLASGPDGSIPINFSKVCYGQSLGVSVNVTTLEEAEAGHAYIVSNGVPMVAIVRSGQAEVNRPDIIAAICGIPNPAA